MLKESTKKLEGNNRYEGFCVDLLNDISNILGFNFVMMNIPGDVYGKKDKDGEWNGMIRELLDQVYICNEWDNYFLHGDLILISA